MNCPYLEQCFKESIRGRNPFFEKERCTAKEYWSKCPVYLKKEGAVTDPC